MLMSVNMQHSGLVAHGMLQSFAESIPVDDCTGVERMNVVLVRNGLVSAGQQKSAIIRLSCFTGEESYPLGCDWMRPVKVCVNLSKELIGDLDDVVHLNACKWVTTIWVRDKVGATPCHDQEYQVRPAIGKEPQLAVFGARPLRFSAKKSLVA